MDDLPLLHRWLQTPQVLEWWWGGVAPTYEAVAEKYGPDIRGEEPTACTSSSTRARPSATSRPTGFAITRSTLRRFGADEEAAGVDLLIGEGEYLHKGLGSHILRRFLREVVFAAGDIASCIIGPSEANTIAIRAYEKAGFRYFKTIPSTNEPTPEYLMRIAPRRTAGRMNRRDRAQ